MGLSIALTWSAGLPNTPFPIADTKSQARVVQLLPQRGQSPMAFPQLRNEVCPRPFIPELPVDVAHPGQVNARLLIIAPAPGLDQCLRLLPVDVDGGMGMRRRSSLGHADQPVCPVRKTGLALLYRLQSQVDFTLVQVDVAQETVSARQRTIRPAGPGAVSCQTPICRDSSRTS